jgi:hypothetical protein
MKRSFGVSEKVRRDADLFFADLTGEPLSRPRRRADPIRPLPSLSATTEDYHFEERQRALPASSETSEAVPVLGEDGGGEGEIILLSREAEEEGEQGELIPTNQEPEYVAEDRQVPIEGIPLLGRILWPALGFPAVVTPSADPRKEPSLEVDATRCLTLLVLTNRPTLSAEEAAKNLRIVPWSQRGRRYIAEGQAGVFNATDLLVRNDSSGAALTRPQPESATEQLIAFGGGKAGERSIVVNLSSKVRKIYRGWGLEFLHEIRVSEAVTARLAQDTYHLFFNNLKTTEEAPSDELTLLIRRWATPRRPDKGPMRGAKWVLDPLEEYEYEYGALHEPYKKKRAQKRRFEVLHPVFIRKSASPRLQLGHITDLHVDVRHDVYQHNLEREGKLSTLSFNNWNDSVSQIYAFAKRDTDALLLTGDLIDYGRGHVGIDGASYLGDNEYYHRDRNWFLLYDVLVAEDRYRVPVYTSLGNHDWRINPYTPFAAGGAPDATTFINDYDCFSDEKRKAILALAHGKGHDLSYSYDPKWKTLDLVDIIKTIGIALTQGSQLDKPGLPTETNIDSVIWYLLTINPFFDYLWALPSGHQLLILDWVEDEAVLFPTIDKGREFPYLPTPGGLREAADAGPKAIRCLSEAQKSMVEHFVKLKNPAKIIGIHPPPIGPWYDWGDDDLKTGFKRYRKRRTRGPVNYAALRHQTEARTGRGHRRDDRGLQLVHAPPRLVHSHVGRAIGGRSHRALWPHTSQWHVRRPRGHQGRWRASRRRVPRSEPRSRRDPWHEVARHLAPDEEPSGAALCQHHQCRAARAPLPVGRAAPGHRPRVRADRADGRRSDQRGELPAAGERGQGQL